MGLPEAGSSYLSFPFGIEGKRFPVKQLVREAANRLSGDMEPLHGGTTAHEMVCVLSHNGFTSRNEGWEQPRSVTSQGDGGTALREIPTSKSGQRLTEAQMNALGRAVADNRRLLMAVAEELLTPETLKKLLNS